MSLRADLLGYADVLEFAGQVLGPCELEQDYSWAHGMSAVLRLRDAHGVTWFAKRHRERDRHEAEVETLSGLPCPGQVPCHRDYTPRNWLVKDGVQYAIDFEHARLDVWLADLARLHLGIWPDRPDLKEAFLAGYGRQLSDTDHAILQGVAALTATWLVVKAREIRQPALEDAFRAALQGLLPTGA
jgi:Ser/Thr protein kinase RdoA (MazF antagonist)